MNPEEYGQLFRLGETHWWFVGTRDILFSIAHRGATGSGEPILDVGCGSGLLMRRFADAGHVFGVDNSAEALAHCRKIGFSRLCQADAERLPFKSGAFDLLIAADMLEHCEDDEAVLHEMHRVTGAGGAFLASVPAYNVLWSAHDVALHHKRRYSRRELVQKVKAAGYTVERASYFNSILFPPVAVTRLTLGKLRGYFKTHSIKYHEDMQFLNRVLLSVMRMERWLLNRCNLPFGLSILLLASKR
jgi:ubiquinone/menaquinone biosynthesis C-methylase UbiE